MPVAWLHPTRSCWFWSWMVCRCTSQQVSVLCLCAKKKKKKRKSWSVSKQESHTEGGGELISNLYHCFSSLLLSWFPAVCWLVQSPSSAQALLPDWRPIVSPWSHHTPFHSVHVEARTLDCTRNTCCVSKYHAFSVLSLPVECYSGRNSFTAVFLFFSPSFLEFLFECPGSFIFRACGWLPLCW